LFILILGPAKGVFLSLKSETTRSVFYGVLNKSF